MNVIDNLFICSVCISADALKIINIVLIGIFLIPVEEKFINSEELDVTFGQDVIEKNLVRLTNQLWKLIPMRENEENWEKQLYTVIIEIAGLGKIFNQEPQFLQLVSKLEGLLQIKTDFSTYRKTVFESISLLRGCLR